MHELHERDCGDRCSAPALLPLVSDQLRQLARRCMAGERNGHTLQATGLGPRGLRAARRQRHEAAPPDWADRAHFFHAAAEAMRHILIDHARARQALKRGGNGLASDHADEPAHEGAWRRAAYSVVDLAAAGPASLAAKSRSIGKPSPRNDSYADLPIDMPTSGSFSPWTIAIGSLRCRRRSAGSS